MITPGSTLLTSAPTLNPVTRAEALVHMNLMGTTVDDDKVDRLIAAATGRAQNYTNRQFITGTYTTTMENFPLDGSPIWLRWPPLVSVTSITYTDIAGDTQTWASSNYVVDTSGEPGKVALADGASYPSVQTNPGVDAVTIIYVAGYGATEAAAVTATPAAIKNAVLMEVTELYEHIMATTERPVSMNQAFGYLLDTVALPEPV